MPGILSMSDLILLRSTSAHCKDCGNGFIQLCTRGIRIQPTSASYSECESSAPSYLVSSVEVHQCFLHTGAHCLLALSYPDTRIKVLLVGLVLTLWVADLLHDIVLLVEHVVSNASQVCPLEIGVEVDLDHAVADGVLVLLLCATTATVEDEEDWLLSLGVLLVIDILLMLVEKLGMKLDIARLVYTVHVAESCSNTEVRRYLLQSGVDVVDVFGLGVERVVVHILIVDTILFTARDADFLRLSVHEASTMGVYCSPSLAIASSGQPASGIWQ